MATASHPGCHHGTRAWPVAAITGSIHGFFITVPVEAAATDTFTGSTRVTSNAVAAEVTESLRVGTQVLNIDFHHVALLARSAATLDLASDGRLELGIGAGHMKPEYDEAAIAFDRPGRRVDRMVETIESR